MATGVKLFDNVCNVCGAAAGLMLILTELQDLGELDALLITSGSVLLVSNCFNNCKFVLLILSLTLL